MVERSMLAAASADVRASVPVEVGAILPEASQALASL